MRRDPRAYLFDIVESVSRLERYVPPALTTPELESDLLLFDAVKHRFAILGEVICTLRVKMKYDISFITDSQRIEGLRHIVVHDYHRVEAAILMTIVRKHLPLLKEQAATELHKLNAISRSNNSASPISKP